MYKIQYNSDMLQRTPKYFDGTDPPGKKIEEILPKILEKIAKSINSPREAIVQEWNLILGEKMARFTQVVSFSDGVLTMIVKSATLYSLLCQHERPSLLKRLREKFPILSSKLLVISLWRFCNISIKIWTRPR